MTKEYAIIIAALIITVGLPLMFFTSMQLYLSYIQSQQPSLQEWGIYSK